MKISFAFSVFAATGVLAISVLTSCGYGPEARFIEPPATTPVVESLLGTACLPETRAARKQPDDVISESGERSIEIVHEERETISTHFAVGSDCIDRPLKDVWASLHNAATVEWDDSTIESFEKQEPGPGDTFSFKAFQKANPWPHPSWYIDWVHRLKGGTMDVPERVQIIFQKTKGTRFIQHWAGQIILAQKDGCTAAYMAIELKGSRISVTNCKGAITSQFDRLKKSVPDFTHFP